MRRVGVFALVWVALLAGEAIAQPALEERALVSGRYELYVDDDATVVHRPRIAATERVGETIELSQSYLVDFISSASVDVISRASKGMEDVRHMPGAGVGLRFDRAGALRVAYLGGFERDHNSHAFTFLAERDLDEARLWHGSISADVAHARIGTVVDESFDEGATSFGLNAEATRVVNRRLLVRGGIALSHVSGFQASPYRTVQLGEWTARRYQGDDPAAFAFVFDGVTGAARERHPKERTRGALRLLGAQAIGARGAIRFGADLYRDTWAITSGALRLEGRLELDEKLLLRLGGRGYLQSAAFFHRRRYLDAEGVRGYLTSDRELGRARGLSFDVGVSIPTGDLLIDLLVEAGMYRYPDFSLKQQRGYLALQGGLSWRR